MAEKKVTIRLPLLGKDQENQIVWVNNTRYEIRRGINVEVPESVAAVLRDSEDATMAAYMYEEKLSEVRNNKAQG